MTNEEFQTVLNYMKGVRFVWEKLSHAEEIIRAAQSLQSSIGDLKRDHDAESAKLAEAKAAVSETQLILDRAKQAVAEAQARAQNLQVAIVKSQSELEAHRESVARAVDRAAEEVSQKVGERLKVIEADYQARATALQAQIDAFLQRRDAIQAEVGALLGRLAGQE